MEEARVDWGIGKSLNAHTHPHQDYEDSGPRSVLVEDCTQGSVTDSPGSVFVDLDFPRESQPGWAGHLSRGGGGGALRRKRSCAWLASGLLSPCTLGSIRVLHAETTLVPSVSLA